MPYVVRKTDGNVLVILNDGTSDSSTGLTLFGRSYSGYGEGIADNFVHLMEHFARDTAPSNPLEGQIWYDKASEELNVYKSSGWELIADIGYTGSKGDVGYTGSNGDVGYTGSAAITTTGIPVTAVGASGDYQGKIVADSTYLYFCTANYDGTSNIWKRITWSSW